MEKQRTLSRTVDASDGPIMKENITIKNAHAHLPVQALWLLVPVEGLGVLAILAYVATHWQLFVQQTTAIMAWLVLVVSIAAYLGLIYLLVRVVRSAIEALVALVQGLMGAYRQFEEARSVRAANKVSQALLHAGNNVVVYRSPSGEIIVQQIQQEKYNYSIRQVDGASTQPQQLPPPQGIPDVIRYEDIAHEVPESMSLLGIHPSNAHLEIIPPEQLKTVWFVGGSNLGKTNTVFGKVGDCVRWGCKVSICDQHAFKADGLTGKLSAYKQAFLHKPAQSDDEIKAAILSFLAEFQRRRDGGEFTEKLLIVVDEVNGLCEHVVRVSREDAAMIYERYGVEIKKERIKMRVFIQLLVETCGYESRGFDMFGFFISQKAADLYWLRKAAMTVFVHGLLMKTEAMLACNENAEAAELVTHFKKGRTYCYGYEIDHPMELQQPLYSIPVVDSTVSGPISNTATLPYPEEEGGDTLGDRGGKQSDTDSFVQLSQAQKMKLLQVLECDGQQLGQNEIIRKVWGVEPSTRQGNAAAEELRIIRAYIAEHQRKTIFLSEKD